MAGHLWGPRRHAARARPNARPSPAAGRFEGRTVLIGGRPDDPRRGPARAVRLKAWISCQPRSRRPGLQHPRAAAAGLPPRGRAQHRRLAPDVYRGVANVLDEHAAPCEHLMVLRRMPAQRRLSMLAGAGALLTGEVRSIARLISWSSGQLWSAVDGGLSVVI